MLCIFRPTAFSKCVHLSPWAEWAATAQSVTASWCFVMQTARVIPRSALETFRNRWGCWEESFRERRRGTFPDHEYHSPDFAPLHKWWSEPWHGCADCSLPVLVTGALPCLCEDSGPCRGFRVLQQESKEEAGGEDVQLASWRKRLTRLWTLLSTC